MKCPECKGDFVLTWRRYFKTTSEIGRLACPLCTARLLLKPRWFYCPLMITGLCAAYILPLYLWSSGLLEFTYSLVVFIIGFLLAALPFEKYLAKQSSVVPDVENTPFIIFVKYFGTYFGVIFLAIIATNTVLDLVFTNQLNQTLRELKAQGVPLSITEITPQPVPDADNAAPLIKQALNMIPARTNLAPSSINSLMAIINVNSKTQGKLCTDIAGWTDLQQKEAAELIQSDELKALFAVLNAASQRSRYNNNLDWCNGMDRFLPNYSSFRMFGRMLTVKAALEGKNGSFYQAFDTILSGLRMANILKHEPILITQLTRMGCDSTLVEELERLANSAEIPIETSQAIIDELSSHIDRSSWKQTINAERTEGIWLFDHLIYNLMTETNITKTLRDLGCGSTVYKPGLKKDKIIYLHRMSEIQRRFEQPYYRIACDLKYKPLVEQVPHYARLSHALLIDSGSMCDRIARHEATVQVCRVGLALRLYKQESGYYPETLDKLSPVFLESIPVDPCTGKSLVYRKAGDGFLLYSLGPNQIDDNGKPIDLLAKQPDKDFDIVWKCGR